MVYNKLIELVHLDDRKAIKELPLDKQEFNRALTKIALAKSPK